MGTWAKVHWVADEGRVVCGELDHWERGGGRDDGKDWLGVRLQQEPYQSLRGDPLWNHGAMSQETMSRSLNLLYQKKKRSP